MLHFRRDSIKGRMAIDLVLGRIKERIFIDRVTGIQVRRADHPDADPFVATGINVASIFDGHLGIGSMQAAYMLMGESILAPNENLPQWPVVHKEAPGTPSSPGAVRRFEGIADSR